MKRKLFSAIIGGFVGFVVGVICGGYFGLVLGGTFLGSFEIHKYLGFEGYELAAYVGAIIGAVVNTTLGIILALRNAAKTEKNL